MLNFHAATNAGRPEVDKIPVISGCRALRHRW
jgi:hypothetical protein